MTARDLAWGLGAAALLAALHVAWAAADSSLPVNDDAALYLTSACLFHRLPTEGLAAVHTCQQGAPYPPGLALLSLAHYLPASRPSLRLAVVSLWPAHALLGFSLYALVRREGGRLAGLAAALTGSVLVLDTGLRGSYFAEVPLAALAVAALALLSAPGGLTRVGHAAALGAVLGLGLLMKWSFAFLMGVPMALVVGWNVGAAFARRSAGVLAGAAALVVPALLAWGLAGGTLGHAWAALALGLALAVAIGALAWRWPWLLAAEGPARLRGVLTCALVTAALAGPWYVVEREMVATFLSSNLAHEYHGDALTVAQAWPFYLAVLVDWVQTPLLCLAGLGALRLLLPGRGRAALPCLLVLVGFVVVLTLLPYRTSRYLLPGLILLAPVLVLGAAGLGRVARAGWALLVALGLAYHVAGLVPPPPSWGRLCTRQSFGLGGTTRDGLWQARDLLRAPRPVLRPFARLPMPFGAPVEALGAQLVASLGSAEPFRVVIAANDVLDPLDVRVGLAAWRDLEQVHTEERPLAGRGDLMSAAAGFGACARGGRWPRQLVVVAARSRARPAGQDDSPWPAEWLAEAGLEDLWRRPATAERPVEVMAWWGGGRGVSCRPL